jgi:anti-sigma-K factor RskA
MTMDRHVEAEMLEAYALGQLSDADRLDVDAHLDVCAACAADLRELDAVLSGIGESVPPIAPSAALRHRVLASVAQEAQETASSHRVVRRDRPAPSVAWMAAAAVLLLAVGALAFRAEQSRRLLENQLSTSEARNADLEERLRRFSGQTDLALSILTAGDMREIPLTGSGGSASVAARAYMSPARGLLLVADRLPEPPPGRVYQVWVIEGGRTTSAGLLGGESAGRGMLIVTPPRPDIGASVTVAVTDEPAGGLPAPSGTVRFGGSI